MRTVTISALALLFASGCNTFTTIEEACLDSIPGDSFISAPGDKELMTRLNCYRRIAKRPKGSVDKAVQTAVEAHGLWLETNSPSVAAVLNEQPGTVNFTGNGVTARLDAANYLFPPAAEVLEISTVEYGDIAGSLQGGARLDFWFDDPFLRPAFLQPVLLGTGVTEGEYVISYPDSNDNPDVPVSFAYWNFIYSAPTAPYAEVPAAYPRNGQLDAPPVYTHLSSSPALELGRTYGYPITFTVGYRETNVEVLQASITGPNGSVPFQVLTGSDAVTALRLVNTAIIVPDLPLAPNASYQVSIKIKTDQGERRATTVFTTGGSAREIPAGLQARGVDMPLYNYRITSLGQADR